MTFRCALVFMLLLTGPVLGQPSPTGEGDPNAISCRPPQLIAGSRLRGPQVCRPNRVWAQYLRDGMDVAPDGIHDMPRSKAKSLTCQTVGGGGGNTGMAQNGATVCE